LHLDAAASIELFLTSTTELADPGASLARDVLHRDVASRFPAVAANFPIEGAGDAEDRTDATERRS